jgi:uncharacterized protein
LRSAGILWQVRPVPGQARLSIGTAAATWAVAFLVSNLLALVILGAAGHLDTPVADRPIWTAAAVVVALWVPTFVGLRYVSRRFGVGRFADDFGLSFRASDLAGIPIGVLSQLVILELVYWPLRELFPATFGREQVEEPARNLFDRSTDGWLIALIFIVVVGAPLIEELLYRGLILRAIEGRIATSLAIIASSLWFAAAHGQPVQLAGLFVFAIVLAGCALRTRRLGLSIVTHAAFNATTVVILLLDR